MMYVGFFVKIAEISNISSVNCGLYSFRNVISFFEFWFSIFLERFVIQY